MSTYAIYDYQGHGHRPGCTGYHCVALGCTPDDRDVHAEAMTEYERIAGRTGYPVSIVHRALWMADPSVASIAEACDCAEDVIEAINAGCDGYLVKPIDVKSLCAVVEGWLKDRKDKGRR